jgi:AraC-like DNA-binding protein
MNPTVPSSTASTPSPAPLATNRLTAQQSRTLVAQLRRSQVYRDYEQAFRETTGLPITLRPLEAFDLPHHDDPQQSPFCALMSKSNHSCAACLQLQRRVEEEAQLEPKTLKCFAGMCDSAVPVRVGDNLVAFLQTGQILTHRPSKSDFTKATKELLALGSAIDVKRYEEAYYQTRVVTKRQYESIIRLLTIFGQHLSALSNQLMVQVATAESPAIARARSFIALRYTEEISLGDVARSVNMSAFYFCKSFKRATGMTFTDYLARVRIERVKNLLLNPHKRVSEAAYEAGFQSLSQFNRVFRRVAGESPSDYRQRLHGGNSQAAPAAAGS